MKGRPWEPSNPTILILQQSWTTFALKKNNPVKICWCPLVRNVSLVTYLWYMVVLIGVTKFGVYIWENWVSLSNFYICTDLIGKNRFHDNIYKIKSWWDLFIFLYGVLFSIMNIRSDFPQRYEKLAFKIIIQWALG